MIDSHRAICDAFRPLSVRNWGLLTSACFVAILGLGFPLVRMPPVWDAVGVFAPAVYLYENGFDLAALFAAPGYLVGGPNIHSLSLITFVTLAAIASTGGDPSLYLPFLHVFDFGLAAVAVTATFALARRLVGDWTAALVALALLLFPLFLVQTGALYTEVAGATAVLGAIAAFAHGRFGWMAVAVAVACLIKSFGVVLVAALGSLVLLDLTLSLRHRVQWLAVLAVPAAVISAAHWAVAARAPAATTLAKHLDRMLEDLLLVPDVLALGVLSIVALAVFAVHAWRNDPRVALRDVGARIEAACLLVPAALFAFVALAPLSGAAVLPLPRYYVWGLAPMLVGVATTLARHVGARTAAIAIAVLLFLLPFNHRGALYPAGKPRNFSIAERSFEYLDFYEIQKAGVEGVAETSRARPVFVTRGEYYYLSSPMLGWVARAVPNVHFVLRPRYADARLANYPPEFLVLKSASNYYHGQNTIKKLIAAARRDPSWRVQVVGRWHHGIHEAKLFLVRRTSPAQHRRS